MPNRFIQKLGGSGAVSCASGKASKVVNSNQSAALSLRAIAERGLGASFWRRARPSVGGAAMVPAHVHR